MNLQVLLPIALFLAMGVLVIVATWRIVTAGSQARRTAQAVQHASDVALRADACLTRLATELDDLRHRRQPLSENDAGSLASTAAETKVLLGEAEDAGNRTESKAAARLVAELERAARALELVEYGRGLVEAGRDNRGEGDQAMKRGYLDLVHARDAIRERARELSLELTPAPAPRAVDHR